MDTNFSKIMNAVTAPKDSQVQFQPPKLYLCGFPKSGLHLAERLAMGALSPEKHFWYGANAWETSLKLEKLKRAAVDLGEIRPGRFKKGHVGYNRALEELMVGLGIGIIFLYRDLRDVVVSQTYHILEVLEGTDDLKFPHSDDFRGMGKDEIMRAVITGHGGLDGLIERWETYAPWLESRWVLPLTFAEMRKHTERAAKAMFSYLYGVACPYDGYIDCDLKQAIINNMVLEARATHLSATFRRGKTGSWKYEFTPEIVKLFKKYDPTNWVYKLGFDKEDW